MTITIRGTTYPGRHEAARAFDVTPQAISMAKSRGTLDRVGLHGGGKPPVRITIRGVTYPSVAEACRRLGVQRATYQCLKQAGRLENLGTRKKAAP